MLTFTLIVLLNVGERHTHGLSEIECLRAVMAAQIDVSRIPGAELISARCQRESAA